MTLICDEKRGGCGEELSPEEELKHVDPSPVRCDSCKQYWRKKTAEYTQGQRAAEAFDNVMRPTYQEAWKTWYEHGGNPP